MSQIAPAPLQVAFTLAVLHVDDSAAGGGVPAADAVEAAAVVQLGEGVQYRRLPLHRVFEAEGEGEGEDEGGQAERLAQLLEVCVCVSSGSCWRRREDLRESHEGATRLEAAG